MKPLQVGVTRHAAAFLPFHCHRSPVSEETGKGELRHARSAEETDRHFLLVSLVIIYAVFATIIAVAHLAQSSAWVHLLYFFVTGILWVLPAMGIIWWMAQPPRKKQH